MNQTLKVKAQYQYWQVDDGTDGLMFKAEAALKAQGCAKFMHTKQFDLQSKQCILHSSGFVFE